MNYASPRQMSVIIAIITAIFCGAVYLLTSLLRNWSDRFAMLVLVLIIVFIAVYYLVNRMLHKFIFEKINPIYKTIQGISIPYNELEKKIEDNDIIPEVNRDVIEWAKKKTREITQLKQMEKYRKEFLGNVSHELKTPIFNIQGYILTLLDGGLEDESINRNYLERSEKSINRMISIVEDLESISRLESGELKLEITTFNIIQLFEEVFDFQEMRAKTMKIKLKFLKNYDKPHWVKADKKRIFEVANNLIVNSINYGKENSINMVSIMEMGENYLIEVTDKGIGIAEKDMARIFERFYRTDKSRSRDQGGTGLGLAIVKHIIEAHNQTIHVSSYLGKGSSFAFTLKKSKYPN